MRDKTTGEKLAEKRDSEARQKARAAAQQKLLEDAFKRVAKTEDGKLILRWIMNYCGWKELATVLDRRTLRIDSEKTLYNDARRYVWDGIRKLIPWNLLNEIEKERKPQTDEDLDDE